MSLASGTKLGPYEIVAPLGMGGMGEVYRARDTRLDRTVAIKIVRAELSGGGELRQRLEREAKAVSALNHPNICTLHDIGNQDGMDYLVMEYIEGETLAERLHKRPLAIDQVLKIGMEVADGLDRAHRAGIIHRDLKPANIMLTKTGAKLMDFGLARSLQPVALGASSRNAALPANALAAPGPATAAFDTPTAPLASPPHSAPLTVVGTVVGTVQYMSPEQVDGKELGPASDIFAFGAVLYEMVTGRAAFTGSSPLSVASAVLEKQPEPVLVSQPSCPPALDTVIRTCLQKDPDERYASAHDVRLHLKQVSLSPPEAQAAAQPAERRSREVALTAGLVLAVVAAAWLAYSLWRQPPAARQVIESTLELPQYSLGGTFGYSSRSNISSIALSPDAQYLAFTVGNSVTERKLWLRPLRSSRPYSLPGTEGALGAFWSPDSKYLAFFASGQLKKVALADGVVNALCAAPPNGGAWGAADTIVFAGGAGEPLNQVSAGGGSPQRIDGTNNGIRPFFLPDGKHFLYVDWSNSSVESGVKVGNTAGQPAVDLGVRTASRAVYGSGYVIYATGTQFIAQRLDLAGLHLFGGPQVLVEGGQPYFVYSSPFSVSANGVFAFRRSGGNGSEEIRLHSLDGRGEPSGIAPGYNNNPRFSPDGSHIAYDLISGQGRDVWVFDIARRVNTRFTLGRGNASDPVWSPDGKRIAYAVAENDKMRIVAKAVDGGAEETLYKMAGLVWARSWSADGRFLFMDYYARSRDGSLRRSIEALELATGKTLELVPDDRFDRRSPDISLDGRWLAYVSNVSGREEVYVQEFPSGSNREQVSSSGGVMPRWRGDGREIYFITGGMKVAAATVSAKAGALEFGVPRELFALNPLYPGGNPLDVTRDGKRFVVDVVREGETVPVTLIANWDTALRK